MGPFSFLPLSPVAMAPHHYGPTPMDPKSKINSLPGHGYCSNRKVSSVLCFETFALVIQGIIWVTRAAVVWGRMQSKTEKESGTFKLALSSLGCPQMHGKTGFIIRALIAFLIKTCSWVFPGLTQQLWWCHHWLGLFLFVLHCLWVVASGSQDGCCSSSIACLLKLGKQIVKSILLARPFSILSIDKFLREHLFVSC